MEGEVLKYGWLIVLTLASIINVWMKMVEKRNHKKLDKPENPNHGERITAVETEIKNLKDDNKEDHGLMRKDIRKLFNLLNG
ncbi:hypothetical protein KA005_29640, partial [bacterium]|nr:hypothetical protein [bacterium]